MPEGLINDPEAQQIFEDIDAIVRRKGKLSRRPNEGFMQGHSHYERPVEYNGVQGRIRYSRYHRTADPTSPTDYRNRPNDRAERHDNVTREFVSVVRFTDTGEYRILHHTKPKQETG